MRGEVWGVGFGLKIWDIGLKRVFKFWNACDVLAQLIELFTGSSSNRLLEPPKTLVNPGSLNH